MTTPITGQGLNVYIPPDDELSLTSTKAAQNKVITEEITNQQNAIRQLGDIAAFKTAILQLAQKVAYIDEHGQNYYDDLYDALYPAVPIDSISAVFVQGSTVIYNTDTLDDLKPMLTVTATYEDQTTEVVTNYVLSGVLDVGTSIITVTYKGKTDTFNVFVTDGIQYVYDGTDRDVAWSDTNSINGVHFTNYTLVSGYSVSGGSTYKTGACPNPVVGRATSRTQIITGVHDGQTVGLTSYVLSTSVTVSYSLWYGYIDSNNNTFNGSHYISSDNTFTARAWLSSSAVLPTNSSITGERFLMIGFKKGDGTTEFTAAELTELQTLISIT